MNKKEGAAELMISARENLERCSLAYGSSDEDARRTALELLKSAALRFTNAVKLASEVK